MAVDEAQSSKAWAWIAFSVTIVGVSACGLVILFTLSSADQRQHRQELLLARELHEPSRGFTVLEARRIEPPDFASSANALVAESDAKRPNVGFFGGVTQYRVHWLQFANEAAAEDSYDAARLREDWVGVDLPPEFPNGFYVDGYCATESQVRWQCLHRAGDTLIVGEALTDAEQMDTPFAPHHALQIGTKGWIDVRSEYANSRRRGMVGAGLLTLIPWGIWGAVRWCSRIGK